MSVTNQTATGWMQPIHFCGHIHNRWEGVLQPWAKSIMIRMAKDKVIFVSANFNKRYRNDHSVIAGKTHEDHHKNVTYILSFATAISSHIRSSHVKIKSSLGHLYQNSTERYAYVRVLDSPAMTGELRMIRNKCTHRCNCQMLSEYIHSETRLCCSWLLTTSFPPLHLRLTHTWFFLLSCLHQNVLLSKVGSYNLIQREASSNLPLTTSNLNWLVTILAVHSHWRCYREHREHKLEWT